MVHLKTTNSLTLNFVRTESEFFFVNFYLTFVTFVTCVSFWFNMYSYQICPNHSLVIVIIFCMKATAGFEPPPSVT